jgi:hypothetical protein
VSCDYEILDNYKEFNITYLWSLFHIRCRSRVTIASALTSIFTLGGCNVNTQHSDFKPLILTTVQNVIGLAIATITSMHTKCIFYDVKSKFFTLLGDYLYNTSTVRCWVQHPRLIFFFPFRYGTLLFTKIHHGKIFHCDNYKYDPTSQLIGGNL